MSSEYDVVIVGAGMAGITAYKELNKSNNNILIIEARNRLGGRAYTDSSILGSNFDYGCSWIHASDVNPLFDMVKNEKLNLVPDDKGEDIFIKGIKQSPQEYETFCEYYKNINESIMTNSNDIAVSEFLRRDPNPLEYLAANCIGISSGLDLEQVSTEAYRQETNTGKHHFVKEGLGSFVNLFAKNIPINFNTEVYEINWENNVINIRTNNGDIRAKKIIITTSIGVLKNHKIRFVPELPIIKQEALASFSMALLNKIAIKFKPETFASFSENHCALGLNNNHHPFLSVFNMFNNGLVVNFVSGSNAHLLEQEGEKASIDYALSNLKEIFGSDIAKNYITGLSTSWGKDQYSFGSYSAPLPGLNKMRKELSSPIEERIFFAGEAYNDLWCTQLSGAYLSGKEVIEKYFHKKTSVVKTRFN
jgi:monoamine oxidase